MIADAAQMTHEESAASPCSTCLGHAPQAVTVENVPAERILMRGGTVLFKKAWLFFEDQGERIGLAIHDSDMLEPLDEVLVTLALEAE